MPRTALPVTVIVPVPCPIAPAEVSTKVPELIVAVPVKVLPALVRRVTPLLMMSEPAPETRPSICEAKVSCW